jgi:heterodisulfide reductase subunit B
MKLTMGYYPGCSLQTGSEYDGSLRDVCTALDIDLAEVPDWNCCGASSGHSTNGYLADALVLRNLINGEKAKLSKVMAPCAACYNLLKGVDRKIRKGSEETAKVNEDLKQVTGDSYQGTIDILHPLEPMSQPACLAAIAKKVVNPLTKLKVVTYYGCLLTRPSYVSFDHNEYPVTMDKVLESTGVTVAKWSYKTDCCGASLSLSRPEVVEKFSNHFVAMARRAGADAIITACPLCQTNLDTRQSANDNPMPIFYFTELIGLSLGLPNVKKWMAKHIIDPVPLLRSLKLL